MNGVEVLPSVGLACKANYSMCLADAVHSLYSNC